MYIGKLAFKLQHNRLDLPWHNARHALMQYKEEILQKQTYVHLQI